MFAGIPAFSTAQYANSAVWSNQLNHWIKDFNVHGSVHRKNILICIQQDATLHSLFYLGTALHVSDCITIHH